MVTASYCDCLICRLEASFIAELSDDRSYEEFRLFAVLSPILAAFPTALELVGKLHDHDNHEQNPSSDEVLLDLLRRGSDTLFHMMWQRLLLLVFIPTIHRTTSQIAATFPSLTRPYLPSFSNSFIPKNCVPATRTLGLPSHERYAGARSAGRFASRTDLCGMKRTELRPRFLKWM